MPETFEQCAHQAQFSCRIRRASGVISRETATWRLRARGFVVEIHIRRIPAIGTRALCFGALLLAAACAQSGAPAGLGEGRPPEGPALNWPPAVASNLDSSLCVATSASPLPQALPLSLEVPAGKLVWAHFALPVASDMRPWQVQVTVGAAGSGGQTEGSSAPYWVGVSDYVKGCWQWAGPHTVSSTTALDTTVLRRRYCDGGGQIHVMVATLQRVSEGRLGILDVRLYAAGPAVTDARARLDENLRAVRLLQGGDDGVFSFAVLGDTRSGDAVFTKLLSQIEASGADFIIHLGDLVYHGYSGEFEAYQELIDAVPMPLIAVRGNHEIASGTATFAHYIGAEDWTFDYGGCRFVGLDNGDGKFDDLALQTAKDAIGGNRPTFLCFHMPPPVEPWAAHSMKTDANGGGWGQLEGMLTQGDIRAVFVGHIHLRDEMQIDGIPFVISGAGGSPLATQYKFGVKEFGFYLVDVDHGSASWHWVPLEQ